MGMLEQKELHQWHLNMLTKCQMQFYHCVERGIKRPPGSALIVGSGLHDSGRFTMVRKRDEKILPKKSEVTDVARDSINNRWDQEGIWLKDDEKTIGLKKLRGKLVDEACDFSVKHWETVAVNVDPVLIEKPFKLVFPNGWSLAGTIDITDNFDNVRDLKSARKAPSKTAIEDSIQLSAYAFAYFTEKKIYPVPVGYDHLVLYKKGVEYKPQTGFKTNKDFKRLMKYFDTAIRCITSGIFMPANPDAWWCSKNWCGYWDLCAYGNRI
jgi:CRISPR/Cas system-associated exonuclease Cas4 (RecB family)